MWSLSLPTDIPKYKKNSEEIYEHPHLCKECKDNFKKNTETTKLQQKLRFFLEKIENCSCICQDNRYNETKYHNNINDIYKFNKLLNDLNEKYIFLKKFGNDIITKLKNCSIEEEEKQQNRYQVYIIDLNNYESLLKSFLDKYKCPSKLVKY